MSEFIDGHRWPTSEPSLAPEEDAPRPTDSDQQPAGGAPDDELPPFAVTADYRTCMVAVLFDPSHVPFLMRHPLFQSSADLLRGAQIDCEQWIDEQIKDNRDRQISGGLR